MPGFFNRRRSSCTKLLAQEVISVMAVPGTSIDGKEASAFSILDRAVQLDNQRRFVEATVCYEEGLQLLIDVIKASKVETKRSFLRGEAMKYMDRAEQLKENSKQTPQPPIVRIESAESNHCIEPTDAKTSASTHKATSVLKFHRAIEITNDSIGFSYAKIFGEYLNDAVVSVIVKDPYIRSVHQIYNFLRFCELLVKSCKNLKFIKLVTTEDNPSGLAHQKAQLEEIRCSLLSRNIAMKIDYSETLHDREIRLSNNWVIKIGRGLDYFKPPTTKFSLGSCDYDLRCCHETTVDIYHSDGKT